MNQAIKFSKMDFKKDSGLQAGFTLIELMVAMLVGLLISAGAATLFANTILSTRTLNSASRINEVGTHINSLLTRNLRMSGYVDWLSSTNIFNTMSDPDNAAAYNLLGGQNISIFQQAFANQMNIQASDLPKPLSGCDFNYINPNRLFDTSCKTNEVGGNSAFTVAFQVRSQPDSNGAPSLSSSNFSSLFGMAGDCNNERPKLWPSQRNGLGLFAVNRFYLEPSSVSTALSGEPILYDLRCQGNGKEASEPLISNIEQFVVHYGISQTGVSTSNTQDMSVVSYLTATQINSANAWNQVLAVRTCILVVGERQSSVTADVNERVDCLGNPINFGVERRLRQPFLATVSLRNQTHTAN